MRLEIIVLIVCVAVFVIGVLLFILQKVKGKPKKVKPQKVSKDPEPVKEEKKNKHLRPVLLTAKPAEKDTVSNQARNAEKTEDISFNGKQTDINLDQVKKYVEQRSTPVNPTRVERKPLANYDKIEIFDDEFEDDILPSNMPQQTSQYNPYSSSPKGYGEESEFMSQRGNDKKLYDELKNMSPEMKKIIMADILKRKSDR